IISAIYIAITLYTSSPGMAFGLIGILLLFTITHFDLGLATFLILQPLTGALEISVFLDIGYTSIICFIYFIKLLNSKEKIIETNYGIYLFSLIAIALIAIIINQYFDYFH